MKNCIYFTFVLCTLSLSCQAPEPTKLAAYKAIESVWQQFRSQFNYHIQTIGVSERQVDGSFVMVISEPPRHLAFSDFQEFFKDYNASVAFRQQPFGFDGWVKDVVVAIGNLSDDDKAEMLSDLHKKLFFTDYKAYELPLPYKGIRTAFLQQDMDVSVSVAELKKWLVDEDELFTNGPDSDSSQKKITELFESGEEGLFYSAKPGFVAWLCPADLTNSDELIRKFTLDTDLILGAIAHNDRVAIIAREREIGVFELPPLRIETIKLLASAEGTELAQSYERNHFLAGKMATPKGKGLDWAPIYLSKELQNTEYGSLLNVTDQMLKSWSNSGMTDYYHFNYPKPTHWVFRDGVMNQLKVNKITYNWNTTAAAYTVSVDDGYTYGAVTSTGALPVSYFPEGSVSDKQKAIHQAEDDAHQFFATLNNPDLVRVVQYASLYQLFRKFNIQCQRNSEVSVTKDVSETDDAGLDSTLSTDTDSPASTPDQFYMQGVIAEILASIRNMDKARIKTITNEISKSLADLSPGNVEMMKSIVRMDLLNYQAILNQLTEEYGDGFIGTLATYLAAPRDYRATEAEIESIEKYLAKIEEDAYSAKTVKLIMAYGKLGYDPVSIRDEMVSTLATSQSEWVKTPTVVVSWDEHNKNAVGGHNLSARMSPFEANASVAMKGRYKINEVYGVGRTFQIHPDDIGQITPKFLREVERASVDDISKELAFHADDIARIRARTEVIPAVTRSERGLTTTMRAVRRYEFAGQPVETCDALIEKMSFYLKKNNAKEVKLVLEGFSEDEGRVILKSAQINNLESQKVMKASLFDEGLFLKRGKAFDISSHTYDFAKATVKNVGDDLLVEIPHITIPQKKVSFWVRIAYLTREQATRLKIRLNKFVANFAGRSPQAQLQRPFASELRAELLAFGREENIDVELIKEQIEDCLLCYTRFSSFYGRNC